jgi:hypothetical protein
MDKILSNIPISLSADSEIELSQKCLRNNLLNDTMFEYYQILKVGKKWVAWFRADISKLENKELLNVPKGGD